MDMELHTCTHTYVHTYVHTYIHTYIPFIGNQVGIRGKGLMQTLVQNPPHSTDKARGVTGLGHLSIGLKIDRVERCVGR